MNDNQDLKEKEFTLSPENTKQWSSAIEYLTKHEDENLRLTVTHLGKFRTLTQNACIHKYCAMLAQALNESGQYRYKKIFGQAVEMPWTMTSVKEDVWHPVQFAMYPHAINKNGEPSSSKLNTVEVGEVYKIISQNVASSRGIDVPWPNRMG